MLRSLAIVTVCFLAAPVGWSQDKKEQPDQPKKVDGQDKKKDEKKEEIKLAGPLGKLSVAWHGQSFFSVQTKAGTVLVFDPHAISQYGTLASELRPDIIFISHNHNDHTKIEIFKNIAEKGPTAAKIITGLKMGSDGRETWNIIDEKYKDEMTIKSVGAYHDDVQGMKHGLTGIFIIDVDGWKICHLGDLGHKLTSKQLKAIGEVDVLMVPCGGIYGLNGSEAQDVVKQIKPKQFILPMHIGNTRYDDLLPVDEFIDESPYKCAIVRDGVLLYSANPKNNVVWLREQYRTADNMLVLERDENRKGPVIVNLHYWPQAKKK